MYDNEYKTKENKNRTKDKIELQHIYTSYFSCLSPSQWIVSKTYMVVLSTASFIFFTESFVEVSGLTGLDSKFSIR